MNFIRNNAIAIVMWCSVIICEHLHSLFEGVYFNGTVTLDCAVFYTTFAFLGFGLSTPIIVFIITNRRKIASKALLAGVIFWNLIEAMENVCYQAGINNNVLIINDGSVWQLSTAIFVMLLSYSYYTRYKL